MSQENVDLSRRAWELFNDREWDAFWSLLDEDVEWHSRADEPDADVYRGQESVRRYVDTWTELFPDIRLELVGESVDLGDQVITPTHLVGNARTTGSKSASHIAFSSRSRGTGSPSPVSSTTTPRPSKPWGWRSRRCRRRAHDDLAVVT